MIRKLRIAIDPGDPTLCMNCAHLLDDSCLLFGKQVEIIDHVHADECHARLPECKAGNAISPDDGDRLTDVEVDCDEKHCGDCDWMSMYGGSWCLMFDDCDLLSDDRGVLRDSECLAAEVAG